MDQSIPVPSSAPGNPGTPPAPDAIDAQSRREMDAAMQAAMAAPAEDHGAHARHKKPEVQHLPGGKPIRGPRVVQSGREHRTGRIVSIGPDDIFIEFGPKELGVVSRTQFTDADLPKSGDELEVVVDKFERDENLLICSRPGRVVKADWELLEPGQIVEAQVTGFNKGGLELEVAKHRAFMPASQVDTQRIEDFTPFVGQKLKCKVVRVDRGGAGNITLSRREIIAAERREAASKLKDELKEGDVREGVVKKIMPFGAFVDIGGMDMLLHVSDLSHDRVHKVEDIVKEGQTIKVQILHLDWDKDRHSIGLKQLQEHPFKAALKDIVEGAEVQGTVTKLTEFGAFVQVAEGVEGLVHISELAWKRVAKTSDVLQPKQVIKVKVLKIDPETRKVSLSHKQTLPPPVQEGRGPGGPGGKGKGRGDKFEQDTRTPEEILKETPALRRLREAAKAKTGEKGLKTGLGNNAALGLSLADLKL